MLSRLVAFAPLTSLCALTMLSIGCAVAPEEEAASATEQPLFLSSPTQWTSDPAGVANIQVCWEPRDGADPAGYPALRQAAREAIEDTWMREANVNFIGWGTCPRDGALPGISIRINDERPHVNALGANLRGARGGMTLNFDYVSWGSTCASNKDFCTRAIAVHEFGHALGFAHEQKRSDTPPTCTVDFWDNLFDLGGDTPIGPWDPQSVMNYCNTNWNNGGQLSAGDIAGVQRVYGRKPDGSLVGIGGRCLDVWSAATADGTPLQTWQCLGGSNQRWTYSPWSRALRSDATGKVADVFSAGTANGTRVQLWTSLNGTNQRWALNDVMIRGFGGKALDIPGGAGVGALMQTFDAHGGRNQQWNLRSDGTIQNVDGLCLEVPGGVTTNGTRLRTAVCNGGFNQRFVIMRGGELRFSNGSGKCVDVAGASTANGAAVQLFDCNGGLNQKWSFKGRVKSYDGAGRCLEAWGFGRENGTPINIWDCHGGTNQTWDFYP